MSETADILKQDGVVVLPDPIAPDVLAVLQQAFSNQLTQRRWNTNDGYEQNERWRRLVEDLFLVHPQFLHIALRDDVLDVLTQFFGTQEFHITEARGWETIKTRKQFHNWHNDAWYDTKLMDIPNQIKLGVYLTDVSSGHFSYAAGTHKHQHRPGHWNDAQMAAMAAPIKDITGPAGTMFLFDTSGIHRQTAPIVSPRHALMFNYHNPDTPLQQQDQDYGRYRSIRIDVAGAASLSERQKTVLGLNIDNPGSLPKQPAMLPKRRFALLHNSIDTALSLRLRLQLASDFVMRGLHAIKRRLPSK